MKPETIVLALLVQQNIYSMAGTLALEVYSKLFNRTKEYPRCLSFGTIICIASNVFHSG